MEFLSLVRSGEPQVVSGFQQHFSTKFSTKFSNNDSEANTLSLIFYMGETYFTSLNVLFLICCKPHNSIKPKKGFCKSHHAFMLTGENFLGGQK